MEQMETCQSDRLFGEFPYTSYEEWRKVAEKSLKGASFEKKLINKTYEDIEIQPIYWPSDVEDLPHMDSLPGFPPYVRGNEPLGYLLKPWEVSQEISGGEPAALNQAARHDLERGQTEFNFLLDQAGLAGLDADEAVAEDVGCDGVSISTMADLAKVLEDIDLIETPVYIQAGTMGLPVLALLGAYMRHQGKSTEKLRGCIGMDPLGLLARAGVLPYSLEDAYDAMAWLTAWAEERAPLLQTVLVQGRPYHDAGAGTVQELAFAAATASEYLGEMLARGISADTAAERIRFSFSSGSDYFLEIAKLRAARLIWTQIAGAFGASEKAQKMYLHVSTSAWNKTIYDPYVNILRLTTEAFAGVMGGADGINVGAFDQAVRPADEFSRRVSRNIHLILNDEAKLTIPVDPSGGSYYVEKMTDAIARKAWALFQEVEAKGGMSKALQEGFPQGQAAQTAARRRANIARRKDIFVGTNMYPNTIEKPLAVNPADHKTIKRRQAELLAGYRAVVPEEKLQAALGVLIGAKKEGGAGVVEAAVEAALSGATLGTLACVMQTEGAVVPSVTAVNIHRGAEIFESLRQASETYRDKNGSPPRVFLANMGPIPQHKARASLGEISYAIEKVTGRHKAVIRAISGVYSAEFGEEHEVAVVRKMADDFEKNEGRRPRIMVAKMGQDGHDRGAKVIATAFADLGFDVDIGPLFQTPEETARQAVENDVHVVGMSSLAAGHKTLLPQLVEELKKLGRVDILVVAGGVIPAQDYDFLKTHGAAAIFGPGTVIPVAAQKVLEEITRRLREAG